jgi:AcrR family transcriptional regulator
VLRATVELLAETGYPGLLVSAIAERAGTSKPAIYRRWPSKAHLVHEAVFPIGAATAIPDTGSLPDDLREMVRRTMAVLTTPAARAALPGLVGEMASDSTLHSALLERFADIIAGGLAHWLKRAAARGEVRSDVTAAELASQLAEAIAGITLVGLLTRATELDDAWIDRTTTLLLKGISA